VRRRYRFDEKEMRMVEIPLDRSPSPRLEISTDSHYEGLRSTDGADISTRRRHQEYMKVNNYALADDFKGVWEKAERERTAMRLGDFDRQARREDIARAFEQVARKRNG
jgi:hypothetical protein